MNETIPIEIPAEHRRAIRFGAKWTTAISVFPLLAALAVFALGGVPIADGRVVEALDIAGNSPLRFGAVVMLDAVFCTLFFVTVVTLYSALRPRWPERASLLLLCGAWVMIVGLAKGLSTMYSVPPLGAAFANGDAAARAAIAPVAASFFGIRVALQTIEGFGLIAIFIIMSLPGPDSAVPQTVRTIGWIMTVAMLASIPYGPAILLVALLLPVWLFMTGRWLARIPVH